MESPPAPPVRTSSESLDGWNEPPQQYNDSGASSSSTPLPDRKRRWTRAERRERAEALRQFQVSADATTMPVVHPLSQQHQSQRQKRSLTTERRVTPFTDQLLSCAKKARHTESIVLFPALQSRDYDRYQPTAVRNVRVVTNCDLPFPDNNNDDDRTRSDGHTNKQHRNNYHTPFDHTMNPTTTTAIHVKPLLVLDLNGILCHRIRAHRDPPPSERCYSYRAPAGNIASTPVIPRTDVNEFCSFLQRHFTLAVWTSAQRKTALQLVQLLLPPHVQERLLFVWAQPQCDRVDPPTKATYSTSSTASSSMYSYYQSPSLQPSPPQQQQQMSSSLSKPDPSQVLYVKDLSKVWKEFPLWNASNTLLMDDSPDKCPFRQNALHPPPIHGQERRLPPPPQPPYHYGHQPPPYQQYQYYHDAHSYATHGHEGETYPPQHYPLHGHDDLHINHDLPMSDEENQARQFQFFERLVYFWRTYPHAQVYWEQEDPHNPPDPTRQQYDSLLRFLDEYGVGHMGWMIPVPSNHE